MTDTNNLADIGIRAFAKYTEAKVPKASMFSYEITEEGGRDDYQVPDALEHTITLGKNTESSSLCKLIFNGTFTKGFSLCITSVGNTIARYRAPYRYILGLTNNTLEFRVTPIFSRGLEIIVSGFTGTITAVGHPPFNHEEGKSLFCQYSGRSKMMMLVTDLMIESADPIESVAILMGIWNSSTDNTLVVFNEAELDANYTKVTGKTDRPKNFAICSIKDKELVIRRVDLKEVHVNEVPIDKQSIHYQAYDEFLTCNGCFVNRYSC